LSSCYQNWTYKGSFDKSQRKDCFEFETYGLCACGLLSNPAKVPKFQYTAWWYSIDQEFHADVEKNPGPQFGTSGSIGLIGHDPAKVPKYMHALSIRNFGLNQAQLIISHSCQLTNIQKMCSLLPWYMEFPIYYVYNYTHPRPSPRQHNFGLINEHKITNSLSKCVSIKNICVLAKSVFYIVWQLIFSWVNFTADMQMNFVRKAKVFNFLFIYVPHYAKKRRNDEYVIETNIELQNESIGCVNQGWFFFWKKSIRMSHIQMFEYFLKLEYRMSD
jgi:hypothetical protein